MESKYGKGMNQTQLSMALLAVVIAAISIWWISTTLKEGRKAVEESKTEQIEAAKAKGASNSKRLNPKDKKRF